jgi:HAD superfamily hydrolase (TIGR01509 family)
MDKINTVKIKAIIFDKDGVLVNSEKLKAIAWQRTLEFYGVKDGFSWYLLHLGPSSLCLASMAIDTFNLDGVAEKISEEWDKNYREIEDSVEPIKENLESLATLASKYLIGLASSMDKKTIEAEMVRFGYREYIQACVSGEDVTNNKPAPDVYLATAQLLQVEPDECIAIEDSPTGISAAKNAGMYCIGFKNPLYDLDLGEADVVTENLSKIDWLL